MSQSRQLAWAYLSRCFEGPNHNVQKLLSEGKDVEAIVRGIKQRESWIGDLLSQSETRYQVDTARQDLETIKKLGGRLVTPECSEWPAQEFTQAFGFAASGYSESARSLQEDAIAPHCLWVRGKNISTLSAQAVAVVGTRAVSKYGEMVAAELTRGLASAQWTIVSGGALGVDAIAHRAALEAGGTTVAIAACGLDKNYPAANAALFAKICESGALISEYPPGISPARHRFLTRNRLVAALSQGTVVVEAAWRSGALNTLTWAEGLGRVAMAVPGPITGVNSLGCHDRIRSGRAQLVASSEEIQQLVSAIGEIDVEGQYEMLFAPTKVQALSRNEMRVYDAMSVIPSETDQIASEAGLTMGLTVHLLVEMQKHGVVCREGTKWRRTEEAIA